MFERRYHVYIMANRTGTIYVGVTGDLERRVFEHKKGLLQGLTKRYQIDLLVYFEEFQYIEEAINREKQIRLGVAKRKTI
jgi:putative endonuclease